MSDDVVKIEVDGKPVEAKRGQMVIEVAAWAGLGVVLLKRWSRCGGGALIVALVGWNGAHVVIFYLWLRAYPHWTWRHTVCVALTLIAVAIVLSLLPRWPRARPAVATG